MGVRTGFAAVSLVLCILTPSAPAGAEVIQVTITSREPFADDVPDKVGRYERIRGRVVYALDPEHQANRGIVDLGLAADNGEGRVEFYGDFEIIAPLDRSLAQPTVLYDVNNRGRRRWGMQPFFLRHGYVTVWSGWIAQVPPSPSLLRLAAPVALDEDYVPVTGTVRAEMISDVATDRLAVSDRRQLAFEPVASALPRATLTRRIRERDAPELIPRDRWEFFLTRRAREESSGLIEGDIRLDGGFEPGVIYELTYEAFGSVVQGAGFAAIRDFVSFLRHDDSSMNPLRDTRGRPLAQRVIGEGRSQSGRALRTFLYEGFNADEQGRIVFDGVMPLVAGGGQGFFNHRFASPTRTATEHSGHLYPVDVFPFTYGDETDPFTGRTDSLLRRARASGTAPKVMHFDTSSEYWHRSASLVVTDPTGQRDSSGIPDDVRIYVFGGSQHGPATGPSSRGQLSPNPNVYQPFLEALFLAMDRWVTDGTPPPPSMHPRIADGTLVGWRAQEAGWKVLPGVRYPTAIQQPDFLDYGEEFATKRRIDNHPPVRTGKRYGVGIPALDEDNNEVGVLRMPAVVAPVATYTGWNLRNPAIGVPDALLGLAGGYIAFPRTKADREASGDPRLSVEERYGSFEEYRARIMRAAEALVAEGYLLDEHRAGVAARAEVNRGLFEE